jgi:Flp pilus assembly protein TadD
VLADEGLKKLNESRYEDASRVFNAGLKFSPTNAQLHFLNGLTYHLLYLRGNEAMKEMSIAGYELALKFDPAHYYAALQLGRLQFDAKRYGASAAAFQRAIDIQPKNGDAYLGLASAAYYAHDLTRARTAAERAASLLSRDAEASRALAMVYAGLGNQAKAREASARYAALEQNSGARARLDARLDQWRSWHETYRAGKGGAGAAAGGERLAQATSIAGGGDERSSQASRSESAKTDDKDQRRDDAPKGQSGDSNGDERTQHDRGARSSWFDCGEGAREDQGQGMDGSGGADEIAPMPRLPSPCEGVGNPRMVVLDIAFIRTEDNATSSHGINLLEGLGYVFGLSRDVEKTLTTETGNPDSTRMVTTLRRSATIAGVTYSLNIANSTDNRAEVLARPSLVALDRMPSTFFSGRNVTLGIAGQAGGASSVTDRPIGISLSATPTFIDAETLLLAVRAQRSFVEAVDLNVGFDRSLQTSRNAVSANVLLKMGQTLILSGLSEREIQRASNGVPVLKDIPVLQYLFNRHTTLDFTRSVLVLITPRPAATDRQMMKRTIVHVDTLSDPDKKKYRPLIEKAMNAKPDAIPENLDGTYGHIFGNTLYLQFRTGDLTIEHWSEPPRLVHFFQDLKRMLYF